jgi:hypothetical protein
MIYFLKKFMLPLVGVEIFALNKSCQKWKKSIGEKKLLDLCLPNTHIYNQN